MTLEQFEKVKYGDILNYTDHNNVKRRVQVISKYRFMYNSHIYARFLDCCEFSTCDAPRSYFEKEESK